MGMRCFYECFGIVDYLNKILKSFFLLSIFQFPFVSICYKWKYHENKITVIREGEWKIHMKMSQWLWNPSRLKFGMNLLAATHSCDRLLSDVTMSCNTQLWQWAATPSYDYSAGENLWFWDMCVLHIMACIWFSIIYNTSIKIHMFYFNIMSVFKSCSCSCNRICKSI